MSAKSKSFSSSGQSIPEWKIVQPGMKPILVNGQFKNYQRLLWEALYFVHYEVADGQLAESFVRYVEKNLDKRHAALLRKLPDWKFNPIGKFTYVKAKGVGLEQEHLDQIQKKYQQLLQQAELLEQKANKVATNETKPAAPVVSIQQRMREQVLDLCDELDNALQDILNGKIDIKQFDPHSMLVSTTVVKSAHAKLIKDLYQGEYGEAQLVVAWKDEQIKEAYAYMTAKMRRDFLSFYEKLNAACDAMINTGKANRKPRKKKAPSKEKLVVRLKYKESEPNIGVASVNPLSVIGANTLWTFNTKNRKLGMYVADDLQKSLSVRGTTITGFDPKKSVQKTVRKIDILKGSDKLPRTKMQKLFDGIRATETAMNGRINEHIILLRVF